MEERQKWKNHKHVTRRYDAVYAGGNELVAWDITSSATLGGTVPPGKRNPESVCTAGRRTGWNAGGGAARGRLGPRRRPAAPSPPDSSAAASSTPCEPKSPLWLFDALPEPPADDRMLGSGDSSRDWLPDGALPLG